MPGLSFGGQSQSRRPSGGGSLWWVSLVLIVLSVALITLCVRMEGGGVFSVIRGGVQTVTKPIESACSVLSTPFDHVSGMGRDEELESLRQENEQLRTLVAELEEYRQQDQRLTALITMSDTYGLETVSAQVTDITTGWDRTATINKGSNDGIKVGQGVVSSCGLYGQVESVTATTSVVRLVNDADSSTAAMIQNSHARGIVKGAYDGTLTLEYVSVDTTVGEGDIVITSGQGGAYPRGLIMGSVSNIETDSSRLYYRITVEPIYSIDDCLEVMVLTGNESSTESLLNEELIEQITNAASSGELDVPASVTAQQGQSDANADAAQGGSSTDGSADTSGQQGSADANRTSDEGDASSDAHSDSDSGGSDE